MPSIRTVPTEKPAGSGLEQLPEFGEATPGSVLDQFDRLHADLEADRESHASSRRADCESKARAVWRAVCEAEARGETLTFPADEPAVEDQDSLRHLDDDDLDLETIPGIVEAKRRGLLPDRFNQSREDYNKEVAAFEARQFAQLRRGADVMCATAAKRLPRIRPGARRASRPAFRRMSSLTRAGPDDPGGSDPEPGPGGPAAPGAAVWRLSSLDSLTPALFHREADRFLVGVAPSRLGSAKAAVFDALPERLKDPFWAAIDADVASFAAELEQHSANGGAA